MGIWLGMAAGDSKTAGGKRRILLMIDNLARAGAQRQAILLTRGLIERGHTVRVLVMNNDIDARNYTAIAAVAEVEVFGKLRLVAELGPFGLWRRFLAWHPDVIVTMLGVSDVLGRIAGRIYGRASIVTSIRARNAQKHAWWLWLDRCTMGWADRVVFNSATVVPISQKIEGVRPDQVRVIFNGVDVPAVPVASADPQSLGVDSSARVILTVGRLQPQKRFENLIDAMARLPDGLGQTDLLIAGEGPSRGSLQRQAAALGLAGRVHFLGNREDVPALLALAEVFVLPSAWEGMPNAVMEAMAAGCPVVTTHIDGIVELIPDASYGWLTEPDRPDQIAAALAEALGDRLEAKRRAERARRRVIDSFSVERMVGRYEALFEELAAGA